MDTKSIDSNKKFWFLVGGVIFAFVYAFCITFGVIPKENRELANLILGVILGSCIKDAYSYLFGSTQGSQAKDDTIAANQEIVKSALSSIPNTPKEEQSKNI